MMILPLTEGLDSWWVRCWCYEPVWIPLFWLAAAFWVGSCVGSFLNVCIWRIPHGESIVFAPSHCPKCQNHLKWYDNMPIWGFLHLRGRCRYCKTSISPRYLLMELLLGSLFALTLAKVGWMEQPPAVLLLYLPMVMLCVTTFFIDWEHRLIPDVTTYPAMIFGVAISAALPSVWGMESAWGGGLYSLGSALGFGLFLSLFALIGRKLAGRDALGWGDVKYLMAAGALTGVGGAFFSLLFGSFAGMAYGIWLARKRGRALRRTSIPLGPFLAVGSLIWIGCGEWLLRWYFDFMQK